MHVEPIDLVRRHRGNCPAGAGSDLGVEPLARRCGKQLGVAHADDAAVRSEHHGRGHDRPRQRAAANLVGSGDVLEATPPQRILDGSPRRRAPHGAISGGGVPACAPLFRAAF